MNASIATLHKSGHLRSVDAALGAWLARAFPGIAPDVALAAALAARAVADGHSALALESAAAWLAGCAEGKTPALPEAGAWLTDLRASTAVGRHLHDDAANLTPLVLDAQGRIYLHRYFEYERQLAGALIVRATSSHASPHPNPPPQAGVRDGAFELPVAVRAGSNAGGRMPTAGLSGERMTRETDNGDEHAARGPSALDPEQQRAIDVALAHRFTLVTGGPGSGKTYSVARMLAALAQQAHPQGTALRITLAAPTGKAAARMGESLRAQLGKLDLAEAVAAVIPREAQTLHRLLGISPWRAQPRFNPATPLPFDVVVVDEVSMVDLPLMAKLVDAVSADARLILLGDPGQLSAVEAGNVLGALVEAAHAGPLRDCHVALTHSHRFAADSSLGALAGAITAGDGDASLRVLGQADDASLLDDARGTQLLHDAASAYRPVLAAASPAAALHAARGFRVLTALRHGPAGCLALDAAINARLQCLAGVRADDRHWRGRLLLITANRPELGLYNGDTGVVWPDAGGKPQAWFESGDATLKSLPVAALPPHEGAFALTVHKAQGSEFDRIALVTGPDSAVLTRELLYTGVTRARSGVTLHSTPATLHAGIARRTLRMSGLADRLREAAGT